MRLLLIGTTAAATVALFGAACSTASSDCDKLGNCNPSTTGAGGATSTTTASVTTSSSVGGAGTGGASTSTSSAGGASTTTTGGGGSGGSMGLPNGATCAMPGDCASGFCIDMICCSMDCSGTCETCAGDGMSCAPAPLNTMCDVKTEEEACTGTGTGDAACLFVNGVACGGDQDCVSGNCVNDMGTKTCEP